MLFCNFIFSTRLVILKFGFIVFLQSMHLDIFSQNITLDDENSKHPTKNTYHYVRIENLAEQEIGESIFRAFYKRAGIPITLLKYPGERCRHMASNGEIDGEMMRIYSYGERNPMLIRVPTPYYYLDTTVFAKTKSKIIVKSKNDLRKYSIVVVRGVQHTKDMTDGLVNVHIVNDTEQMMLYLNEGRADIALANSIDGKAILKKLKINSINPIKTLAVHDLYHYIHVKNKLLVPIIDKIISDMKHNGELKKLISVSEAEFLK